MATTKKTTVTAKRTVPTTPKKINTPSPSPVYVPQETINSQIPKAGRTGITTAQVAPNKNNTFVPRIVTPPSTSTTSTSTTVVTDPSTSTVTPPPAGTVNPPKGTILRTQPGSAPGTYVEVYADGNGGETLSADMGGNGVIPGPTGTNALNPTRTLAEDTFANTFALIFGPKEGAQSYVKQLYSLVGNYYKSGSSIDDSLNLALHDAQYNNKIPEFTHRFSGLFALQAKAQSGQAVQVPTIAEFIAAENQMGDILRTAGMGDLATQDYLGQIIGQGKSVNDVAQAIKTSFNAIDNAPQDVKDTLATQFPMLDRTTLAKSLLMGADGVAEIQKKIDLATTVTAASKNELTLSDAQKQMLATSGLSYGQQLQGLGNVAIAAQRGKTLSDIYGPTVTGYGQDAAIADQFQGLASAQRARAQLVGREVGSFSGSSGTLGPSYGTPRSSFNKPDPGQI